MAITAQQVYEFFHVHATGTDSLAAAQDAALQLWSTYEDRADATQQLINSLAAGWKGQAQEAASQGLAPLAENSYQTGQALDAARASASSQIDIFHATASKVTAMPAKPALDNPLPMIAIGLLPPTAMDQVNEYNQTAQNNLDAYRSYRDNTLVNTQGLPDMSVQMAAQSAPVAVATSPTSTGGATAVPAARHRTGTPTAGGGSRPVPTAGSAGGNSASGFADPQPVPVGSTAISRWSPPPASSPGPATAPPVGPGSLVTDPPRSGDLTNVGGSAGVGFPLTSVPVDGVGAGGDVVPLGEGGTGEVAPRPGSGSATGNPMVGRGGLPLEAPGEGGVPMRTGTGSGVGEDGPEERGGSAVPVEEDELANPRGLSASRTTTTGPMGVGRGGRGADDQERKTKFVVAEDHPEELGVPGPVIPPVIGETPEQEQRRRQQGQ